ncbi:Eco57I restriction-modification methylase domain-containing protein [Acidaminococcus sp. BV3L6]|uniref:Eco57I restriction-modification methylase domain-containing protein n=1 Tax=Acidaminococcus sp. (strain BV3L6) TaxID=1111120 RepID=UPI0003AE5741|nr:Eco57I restriction-modification methylase domain-containing protein [Acidaminococcus sp. BV3L6]ERL20166.1 Eco57I restriction-modification methylase [Acidaminococcus sp. BV3L6]
MERLIDVASYPVLPVLDKLLQNKSTKKNIIWATDTYASFGNGFQDTDQIDRTLLLQHADVIRPRIRKSMEDQAQRTRKKAEVFTPAWVCNEMNNVCDEDWFHRKNVFNTPQEDHSWVPTEGKIELPKRKRWQCYVDSRRLEITCGEAPYLCSRYDASTGERIEPLNRRIGIVDRKLRVVNENTQTREEWVKWAVRALDASYGYEYQGDNVLIARVNLYLTFIDYYKERWGEIPPGKLLRKIANRIAWNIWQMDGLKDIVPTGKPYEEFHQMTFGELFSSDWEEAERKMEEAVAIPAVTYNWRSKLSVLFRKVKEKTMGKKLFDFVIGNPPYQEETANDGDRKNPIYNLFMDQAYDTSSNVELITPARFLFNAGQTPKAWNKKMLEDTHLKVLYYEPDATRLFHDTEIKGGIAITFRSDSKDFGAIGTFTSYQEMNGVVKKVNQVEHGKNRLDSIIASQGLFRFSKLAFDAFPQVRALSGKGTGAKIVSNIIKKAPELFSSKRNEKSIRILGRIDGNREYRFINKEYIENNKYIDGYKLFLPEANSQGHFGETLTLPILGLPGDGSADTYLSAGPFKTEIEARTLETYLKTKFFRAMLGIKKVTQHCPPAVWNMIPMQDFTPSSDIDWSQSIHDIDLQLYQKYGLDETEIEFIESHVKEMK